MIMYSTLPHLLSHIHGNTQELARFSVKGQITNILGSVGQETASSVFGATVLAEKIIVFFCFVLFLCITFKNVKTILSSRLYQYSRTNLAPRP